MDEWRVKKFDPAFIESELAAWLNGIEAEPGVDYFFLDQLVVLGEGAVMGVVCITRQGGE